MLPLFYGLTLFLAFVVNLAALAGPEAGLSVWVFLRAGKLGSQSLTHTFTADDEQPFFKKSRTKSREFTRTTRACAGTPARPPSTGLPARSSAPAFHFAFRAVWCRGQSHGRGGSRIVVSSRSRDSGTAPCPSSRPSMSPVLALLSSPWWRSLCFVCRSLSEANKLSNAG